MDTPPQIPVSLDYAPAQGQRSSWPVTFGVIAIVFGFFGMVTNAIGIASTLMMSKMNIFESAASSSASSSSPADQQAAEMLDAMEASMDRWLGLSMGMQVCLTLLSIVLLVGGILLIQRKPVAPKLLTGWAYAKIVGGVGSALVGFLMQQEQMRAMQGTLISGTGGPGPGAPPAAAMDGFVTAVVGVGMFVGILWACALPVVLLIWFHREIVKADIATWAPGGASNAGAMD